jgi:hypothetical protein
MSGWYLDGKESLLARTVPDTAGIFVVGVNDEYTFDESHVDFAPITAHILLPETQLSGVSFTNGVLRATNPKWTAAGAGIVDRSLILQGLIVYFQLDTTGTLLAFLDSAAAGLPQAASGADVTAKFNALGILKL